MIKPPIPRNTTSRKVRTTKVDDLAAAGFPLSQIRPDAVCPTCRLDRMGDHVVVLDGDRTDTELARLLRTRRIAGTIENYRRPELPFACATFGVQVRPTP